MSSLEVMHALAMALLVDIARTCSQPGFPRKEWFEADDGEKAVTAWSNH